jgi:hypothetical protein
MNTGLARRLRRLERIVGIGDKPHVGAIIIRKPGESEDQAKRRYFAEHPDAPEHTRFVVITLIAP